LTLGTPDSSAVSLNFSSETDNPEKMVEIVFELGVSEASLNLYVVQKPVMSMAKRIHLSSVTAPAHTLWSIHKMCFNFMSGVVTVTCHPQ